MTIHVTTEPSEGWGRYVVAAFVVAACIVAVLQVFSWLVPVAYGLGVLWLWLDMVG